MANLPYSKQLLKLERAGKEIEGLRADAARINKLIKAKTIKLIRESYELGLNNADVARFVNTTAESVRQAADRAGLVNPRALRVPPYRHPVHRAARRRQSAPDPD